MTKDDLCTHNWLTVMVLDCLPELYLEVCEKCKAERTVD